MSADDLLAGPLAALDVAGDEIHRLRDEVRHLQAIVTELADGDADVLSCEVLCMTVCAGPCQGIPVGSERHGCSSPGSVPTSPGTASNTSAEGADTPETTTGHTEAAR